MYVRVFESSSNGPSTVALIIIGVRSLTLLKVVILGDMLPKIGHPKKDTFLYAKFNVDYDFATKLV